MILRQACSWEYPEAPFAFKNLMIRGICNSHYVSHFAALFISVRAKRSVVKSCVFFGFCFFNNKKNSNEKRKKEKKRNKLLCSFFPLFFFSECFFF